MRGQNGRAGSVLQRAELAGGEVESWQRAGPHLADGLQSTGGSSIGCSACVCFLLDGLEFQDKKL